MVFFFYVILLIIASLVGELFDDNPGVEKICHILCVIIVFDGFFIKALKRAILDPLVKFAGQ